MDSIISTVFQKYLNVFDTEVIVSQIVMTQNIVASLGLSLSIIS